MNFALRRFFSNVPKPQPGKGVAFLAPLEKRGIIGLSGTASFDLLQGICTNDIKKFQKEQDKVSLSTAFLDANGRIFADVLLNKPQIYSDGKKVSKEDEIWIDCDKSQLEDLSRHIKKYVLRKKIDIEDLSDEIKLWSLITPYSFPEKTECGKIWNLAEEETIDPEDEDNYGDFAFVDPRLPMLGIRLVTYAEGERLGIEGQEIEETKNQKPYDLIRTMYGVGEGAELISCLPFTANMDFLGSVSLNKGCYVGQELTARSYHTGVIRKRIMPFIISTPKVDLRETNILNVTMRYHDDSYSKELKDKVIKNKKGQSVGKVLTNHNNVGLAIVSVAKIQEEENFQGLLDNDICSIMSLEWFKTDLEAYTAQIKARDPDLLQGGDE